MNTELLLAIGRQQKVVTSRLTAACQTNNYHRDMQRLIKSPMHIERLSVLPGINSSPHSKLISEKNSTTSKELPEVNEIPNSRDSFDLEHQAIELSEEKKAKLSLSMRKDFWLKKRQQEMPYNGEFGPQTYEPWQMRDYYMIRPMVEEMVSDILTTSLPSVNSRHFSLFRSLQNDTEADRDENNDVHQPITA